MNHFFIWITSNYTGNQKLAVNLCWTFILHVLSEDIGMKFRLDKCASLAFKRGMIIKEDGLPLMNGNAVRHLAPEV